MYTYIYVHIYIYIYRKLAGLTRSVSPGWKYNSPGVNPFARCRVVVVNPSVLTNEYICMHSRVCPYGSYEYLLFEPVFARSRVIVDIDTLRLHDVYIYPYIYREREICIRVLTPRNTTATFNRLCRPGIGLARCETVFPVSARWGHAVPAAVCH